jgi:GWxTD domain-containing protein
MKKRGLFIGVFLLFVLSLFLPAQKQKSPKDLPPVFRKWLEEEVVYIIGQKEKEVFLQLETDRERDFFIEAFWKQRDPTPDTPKNEYKEEHYRRISYANQNFGKESPGPGWRSEMGRIYILLGEPKYQEKYENLTEVRPTTVWLYEGLTKYGLPNAFNVVFFKEDPNGEYKLYSPVKYGPQYLLMNWTGDIIDHEAAYEELLNVSPELAEVSLSLIPGETQMMKTLSIASEVLINSKIPAAGYEGVKEAYAEKLLAYKDRVEVEYSANYIDNDAFLEVIRDKSGVFFVHYLIEPKKLTIEEYQGKFLASLEIDGRISDSRDKTVHQVQNKISAEFTKEQMANMMGKLFSYQDMFPLIPGSFKFSCLLKNAVSKEFTSFEANISIPETPPLQIGSLVLANRIIRDPQAADRNKPFKIGDIQLVPSPRNDFSSSDTIHLYFQIFSLSEDLRKNGKLEFVIFNEKEKKLTREKPLREYMDSLNFYEELPLAGLSPGYYTIKATLFDQAGREVHTQSSQFSISLMSNLPRPWIMSPAQPALNDIFYINVLGNQYLNQDELDKAKSLLEKAHRVNPRNPRYALDYIRALYQGKEYERVKQIAPPFIQGQNKYEFLELLGRSCQALGQYAEAAAHYQDYLMSYGTNILILNSVGDCYFQMGNTKEALVAWEKSLQLDPKQDELRKRVQQIKDIK